MDENTESEKIDKVSGLPLKYQLGERIFKTDLYIENYIVKLEIYKPKDKIRRPTFSTINRIFRKLGEVRVRSTEEVE